MITLAECIRYLRPEAEWSLVGHTLDGLTWEGPGEAPTQSEVDAAWQDAEVYYKRKAAKMQRSKFKLALLDKNYLDTIENFVAQTSDRRIKILWEDAEMFARLDPDLNNLALEIGYTEEQLDALFGIN